jgi:thioesterase domain-containing protein
MARQLKEKGKEVGFLGLIEYRPPAYRYALDIRSLKMALSRARVIISNIMHAPGGQRIKRTVGIPATLWEFAAKSLRPTVALPGSTKPLVEIEYPDWITCQPETYRETCMWDYRAVKEYVPKGYDGKVTLFISLGTNEEFERDILYDRRMGWEKYIKGPIETIFTPGCHTSIMQKPNVDELALKIDQCLEKA